MLVAKEYHLHSWLTLSASVVLSVSIMITINFENIFAQEQNSELEKLLDKGDYLFNQSRYQEATNYYDKALGIDPNYVDALNNKGVALDNLGRYEEAITYYDKALEIDPNDVDALNNKIAALGKLTPDFIPASYYGNAYDHLQGYIYVSSSLPANSTKATTSDTATCENIQKLVDTALNLKPDDVKILTNAGKNLAQKCGNPEESIPYYDRALKVDANYVPALYNKGVSLEKLGNHEEAQALFDKAKQLDPSYKGDFIVGAPRLAEPLPSPI